MCPTHALDASETRCFESPERETPKENTEISDHPDSSAAEHDVAQVACRSHPSIDPGGSSVENDRQGCISVVQAATATSMCIARKGKMRICISSTDNCVAQVSLAQANPIAGSSLNRTTHVWSHTSPEGIKRTKQTPNASHANSPNNHSKPSSPHSHSSPSTHLRHSPSSLRS